MEREENKTTETLRRKKWTVSCQYPYGGATPLEIGQFVSPSKSNTKDTMNTGLEYRIGDKKKKKTRTRSDNGGKQEVQVESCEDI